MRQDRVTVEIVRGPASATLRVTGEIDMSTAPAVHEAAINTIRLYPALHIDLSDVTFMDSAGIHVLLATQRRAERNGGNLRLVHPTPRVMRVLEITGVAGMFEIETDDPPVGGESLASLP
jgi:anti-sigma B factor antagonist